MLASSCKNFTNTEIITVFLIKWRILSLINVSGTLQVRRYDSHV
jgi:hypothetical protein